MDYTTQMDAARKGILTGQLRAVAVEEKMEAERLRELVAKGQAVIPANKNHVCLKPRGIGRALRTKINVNLGVSRDCLDLDEEFKKVEAAVAMGAEAIMDLSSFGDTKAFRQKLVHGCTAVLGTVPIYDAVVYYNKPLKTITSDEWIDVVRMHAQEGVDFMTIHCGINRETARKFKGNQRHTNIVSRGGSIIFAWMELTGEENPFYARFDEILEICREYDVTLSLGDACRPGSIADAGDIPQIEELVTLGELTQRAWKRDVQVMIEGPGHMPLNQIRSNMEIEQTVCKGAPFYVLGPLVTDVAPRLRPHHQRDRRGDRGYLRRLLPVLCNACRAPAVANSGGCKGGDYRLQNCRPRGGCRQGPARRGRMGLPDERGQEES